MITQGTSHGPYSGVSTEGVVAYLGIRYGEAQRFAPIRPAGGQLGVDSITEVPIFPQLPSRLGLAMGQAPRENPHDEQAFYLNVWSSEDGAGLPVLVFLHGGAWMTGGGAVRWYGGAELARRGVVVVTVNYRIGPFAHLTPNEADDTTLSIGDLLCALRWVQDGIAHFGGDPSRVTVVGQSAGGWYGHLLSVLPAAKGMLEGVAHLSAGNAPPWGISRRNELSAATAARLSGGPSLDALATAPVPELLEAGASVLKELPRGFAQLASSYMPSQSDQVPEWLLDTEQCARNCHASRVYARYTAQETGVFFFQSDPEVTATADAVGRWLDGVPRDGLPPHGTDGLTPYETLVAVSSWQRFGSFAARLTDAYALAGIPTESRIFTLSSPMARLGSAHCFDLPFQFGDRAAWSDAPMLEGLDDGLFGAVAEDTMADLLDFVTGTTVGTHTAGAEPTALGNA